MTNPAWSDARYTAAAPISGGRACWRVRAVVRPIDRIRSGSSAMGPREHAGLRMHPAAAAHVAVRVVRPGAVGGDGVHRDPALAQFEREHPGERVHPALRRRVDGQEPVADETRGRADVDDPPAALLQHRRQHQVGAAEHGHQVELQVGPPLLGGRGRERGDRHVPADVVDQHVDPAEGGQGVGHHARHLVLDRQVGRPPEHVGRALLACELRHQLARDGVAADDHHPGALGRERQRDPAADIRGRGGDDDDLACQSRLHGLSCLSVGPLPFRRLYQYAETTETTECVVSPQKEIDPPCRWISPRSTGRGALSAADRTESARRSRALWPPAGSTWCSSPDEKTCSKHSPRKFADATTSRC